MTGRRIGIVFNPISGKGRSKSEAQVLKASLSQRGFEVLLRESQKSYEQNELSSFVSVLDLLVVIGGDGTLMPLLPELASSGVPVYMIPAGNESLFAKHFGMRRKFELLLNSIEKWVISQHYLGQTDRNCFFSMLSFGLDSQVIARIASYRSKPIKHSGYITPTLKELATHAPPRLTLRVDGQTKLEMEQGFLIIGNTKQYALNLAFVPEASSSNPELTARFFPYKNKFDFLGLCIRRVFSKNAGLADSYLFQGTRFDITASNDEKFPVQADGEFVGETPIVVSRYGHKLNVLVPAAFNG